MPRANPLARCCLCSRRTVANSIDLGGRNSLFLSLLDHTSQGSSKDYLPFLEWAYLRRYSTDSHKPFCTTLFSINLEFRELPGKFAPLQHSGHLNLLKNHFSRVGPRGVRVLPVSNSVISGEIRLFCRGQIYVNFILILY